MRMVLKKVGKIVCAYCGQEKPQGILEVISNCEHCGALSNKVTVITLNKSFDKRDVRAGQAREVQPL